VWSTRHALCKIKRSTRHVTSWSCDELTGSQTLYVTVCFCAMCRNCQLVLLLVNQSCLLLVVLNVLTVGRVNST